MEEGTTFSFTIRDSLSSSCGLLRAMVMLSNVELSSRMDDPIERAISGSPSTISRVYVMKTEMHLLTEHVVLLGVVTVQAHTDEVYL